MPIDTKAPNTHQIMIIAIDGPAGSGKSSTAKALADQISGMYIDTGAMYRAVALYCDLNNIPTSQSDVEAVVSDIQLGMYPSEDGVVILLNGTDVTSKIRSPLISEKSSQVSQVPAVRELMVDQQRKLAKEAARKGLSVIMEGRDIGTVVFPEADYKFFLVADAETRTKRRVEQLALRGIVADPVELKREIQERDQRDQERETSPLRQAEDAVRIDTGTVSFEEQVDMILTAISGNEV